MDRIAQFLAAQCRWLALIGVLSTVIPLYHLKDARIDNSIEVWLGKKTVAYTQYREFLAKYGNEEFIAIAGEADDPLSEDCLTLQRKLAGQLRQIRKVDDVLDIADIADILKQARPDWKTILQQNDFFRNLLLGSDGRTFGLIVWLKKVDDPTVRRITVEKIESVVKKADNGKMDLRLAGRCSGPRLPKRREEIPAHGFDGLAWISISRLEKLARRRSGDRDSGGDDDLDLGPHDYVR